MNYSVKIALFLLILIGIAFVPYLLKKLVRQTKVKEGQRSMLQVLSIAGVILVGILYFLSRDSIYLAGFRTTGCTLLAVGLIWLASYTLVTYQNPVLKVLRNILNGIVFTGLVLTLITSFTKTEQNIFYEDSELRIEKVPQGFISMYRPPSLILKKGFLEECISMEDMKDFNHERFFLFNKQDVLRVEIYQECGYYFVKYKLDKGINLTRTVKPVE